MKISKDILKEIAEIIKSDKSQMDKYFAVLSFSEQAQIKKYIEVK